MYTSVCKRLRVTYVYVVTWMTLNVRRRQDWWHKVLFDWLRCSSSVPFNFPYIVLCPVCVIVKLKTVLLGTFYYANSNRRVVLAVYMCLYIPPWRLNYRKNLNEWDEDLGFPFIRLKAMREREKQKKIKHGTTPSRTKLSMACTMDTR